MLTAVIMPSEMSDETLLFVMNFIHDSSLQESEKVSDWMFAYLMDSSLQAMLFKETDKRFSSQNEKVKWY